MTKSTKRRDWADFRPITVFARTDAQLTALLVVACLLGGSGVSAPLRNLIVQLLAILLLAFNPAACRNFLRDAPRGLLILFALTLALPLLQLLPLPAAIWQQLPGRDLVLQSFQLAGEPDRWFPLSVAPARTGLAFIGLVTPAAALILAYNLDARGGDRQRKRVLASIAALGVVNVVLGAIQLGQVGQLGGDYISGAFANKNTTGLFLNLALLALFGLAATRARTTNRQLFTYIVGALLVGGIIASVSRSATALLLLVIPACAFFISQRMGEVRKRVSLIRPLLAIAVGVVAIAGLAHVSDKTSAALARFQVADQTRLAIWSDALKSADRFWPVGAGMGTFDEVSQVDESLEIVPGGRAGRAHNDYIEIAIEAGAAGLALAAAWIAYLLFLAIRTREARSYTTRAAALACMLCIALQSIVDYPLRNQAMLCVAGIFIALLCPSRRRQDIDPSPVRGASATSQEMLAPGAENAAHVATA